MSHTNSTTNYSLPQFVTTDKPAWLTDVNNAYSAIDTGIYNAQTKANTADSNATQAITDAGNAATAAASADAKGAGAVASIADTFDATAVYSVGNYVMYNSLLYVCSVAITTPGPWTGSANWTRTTVENIIPSIDGLIAVDNYQEEFSCQADSTATIDIDCTKAGYNLIGAVGFYTGNSNLLIYNCSRQGNTGIRLNVRNVGSTDQTNKTATVRALFIRI